MNIIGIFLLYYELLQTYLNINDKISSQCKNTLWLIKSGLIEDFKIAIEVLNISNIFISNFGEKYMGFKRALHNAYNCLQLYKN